jgi:hypothetical protein
MVMRQQRAWTTRTSLERSYCTDETRECIEASGRYVPGQVVYPKDPHGAW